MNDNYHYNVYYTYLTGLSGEDVLEMQDVIFGYLEDNFGLNAQSTGYSHIMVTSEDDIQSLSAESCYGLTQDLEFMFLEDVIQFVTWLKDFPEICSINYNKWSGNKEIFYRAVK